MKSLCILGDLTDAKDYHPSSLTNRIVERITRLRECVSNITILMGNHDFLRAGHAYFAFLNSIRGVRFITKPYEDLSDGAAVLWLPYTKTPATDWKNIDTSHFNYVFFHQTVGGSVASNGQAMDGDDMPDLRKWPKIYSGDIHVPQVAGPVEYVGSPYPVHFGDKYDGRLVLLDRRGRAVDLRHETINRSALTVRSLAELHRQDFRPGDQLKLRIELDVADKHAWSRIRREAADYLKAQQVEVHGIELKIEGSTTSLEGLDRAAVTISDSEAVERFVRRLDLGGEALDVALEIVK